jgi:hypothetical protein
VTPIIYPERVCPKSLAHLKNLRRKYSLISGPRKSCQKEGCLQVCKHHQQEESKLLHRLLAGAGTSRTTTEARTKHRDDIANAKLILSILPAYLPPLSGAINRDSVPRDFDYALVTTYLPKGIHMQFEPTRISSQH